MMQPPISDYAIIGNGQTAALVSREGSIDWCCWPRFDSPAVFCRLLDEQRGGFFQIAPEAPFRTRRTYDGPTNVLQTTFETDAGVLRLTDFMPAPSGRDGQRRFPHRILRRAECASGRVDLRLAFRPTFDYAQTPASLEVKPPGAVALGRGEALTLACPLTLQVSGDKVAGRHTLSAGEGMWFVVTHSPPSAAAEGWRFSVEDAARECGQTTAYWRNWSAQCRYQGPYHDLVMRSALLLKLLVFEPSGGIIAAPTTSLPADAGGVRNWDYRYTWLRDAGLLLDALQQLGYHDESMQFIDWLAKLPLDDSDELRVMYAVDGEPPPSERELEHLSGYRESRPVRVGNAAMEQTQIDVYGHVLDAVVLCYERMPRPIDPSHWQFLRKVLDRLTARWQEPDHGPWEIRGERRHYLYSKLYCWVGLDRAIRFAEKNELPGEIDRWKQQRDSVREAILSHGFDPVAGAFTQSFGSDVLDASALTIPLTGLLAADDRRVRSTMQRIREQLVVDGHVYRYQTEDGLAGRDAAFMLCGFWLVMNLAMAGQADEAAELFDKLCSTANDVGLFSEQFDPLTNEQRGNFPQGFTHLGLIRAALYLGNGGIIRTSAGA